MEIKTTRLNLLSALLFTLFLVQTFGKTHIEADFHHLKARLNPQSNVEISNHFPACDSPPKPSNQEGLKEKDRIDRLPGQPPVGFKQYGGYITVNETAGRAFFYYFVEAQGRRKPEDVPLVLWLNGGPGCSSLAYGAFQELGPFRVGSDGKTLFKNRFAWNYVANVLFVESPAGVGFSYSNTTEDFVKGGDKKTAADNYIFLLNWLERFPEYKNRDFYITGESYAGHYVPQLAHNIVYHNKKASRTIINLKGILIGNAVINDPTDSIGMYDFFATHALISPETLQKINKLCDLSHPNGSVSVECNQTLAVADNAVDQIDIYNIYYPRCFHGGLTSFPKRFNILKFDKCSDYYGYAYFNHPNVQEALHANVTKIPYDWQPCSDVLNDWVDWQSTVLPYLKEFMANGIKVWIFSGDVDGRVPVTASQYAIEALKVSVVTPWQPWFRDWEVGGYVQIYQDNLTFVTVKGAGHQVPSYRPDRALSLISHFISGIPFPNH
ncbi:serine carboxypeptidase-like 40 [Coffea arabica]|uniref:Carboxypeptidase n=1 Tax=Coffea arabica TaxID=13443 RepID=A0A6P6VIQ5_COFAR|nr:serine carboxypeptidase-like 40 [Coffea arabica]